MSTAYHLARRGRGVVLVDKLELTSGSTWHAAGLITAYHPTPNVKRVHWDSINLYNQVNISRNTIFSLLVESISLVSKDCENNRFVDICTGNIYKTTIYNIYSPDHGGDRAGGRLPPAGLAAARDLGGADGRVPLHAVAAAAQAVAHAAAGARAGGRAGPHPQHGQHPRRPLHPQ